MSYVSPWMEVWNRWSFYEKIWANDKRSVILRSLLMMGDNNRRAHLDIYQKLPTVPKLTEPQIEELWLLGSKIRNISNAEHPLPDVYAAALLLKLMYFRDEHDPKQQTYMYRGQRNSSWDLIPTIQRYPTSDPELVNKMLQARLHTLAVVCEALEQLINEFKTTSLERIAIAQHYGIPSPLCDFTLSPWVALYFASLEGEPPSDTGIVHCFSRSQMEEYLVQGGAGLGAMQVLEIDFVPRIKAQKGLFVELLHPEFNRQHIQFSITFTQHPGLVFQDERYGVTKANLFPDEAADRFARFASAKLDRYDSLSPFKQFIAQDYFNALRKWYPERFEQTGETLGRRVLKLCEFHCRLQTLPNLRRYERSFSSLRSAMGLLFLSQNEKNTCETETLVVNYYMSQARDESAAAMKEIWNSMEH